MSWRRLLTLIIIAGVAALAVAWFQSKRVPPHPARPIGAVVQIVAPLGLPPVPVPADNPATPETIALGRKLYYDPILSSDKTISCASCHGPETGFCDGQAVSDGIHHQKGTRNAPTVLNAAYNRVQFWDGRALDLEKQAEGPPQNPIEMGHTLKGVEERLNADPGYRAEFERAFGPGPVTFERVEKAIASFERTVISGNSPFDRYYYGGDKTALSEAAQRGFEVFRDPKRGNCTACHTIGEKYALFTDGEFHNIGVGVQDERPTDLGRYNVTKQESDKGAFKTPTLRNIARTGPYMHDGSLKTLKDVVDYYIGGANSNPHLDKEIRVLDFLTGQERNDLRAFLESLSGEMPPNVGPPEETHRQARLLSKPPDR